MLSQSFSNPILQKISSEAEPFISSHLKALTSLQKDIKDLEAHLKSAAIYFNFVYVFSKKTETYTGVRYQAWYDEHHPYNAILIKYEEHCLAWGKDNEGNYRLSYNIYETEDETEPKEKKGTPRLIFSKPLIETKVNLRLKAGNELPDFFRAITNSLKSKQESDYIIEVAPCLDKDYIPGSILSVRGLA